MRVVVVVMRALRRAPWPAQGAAPDDIQRGTRSSGRNRRCQDGAEEGIVHEVGGAAFDFGQDVGVDLAGGAAVGVAEAALHDVFGDAGVGAGGGRGVPGVVQRDHRYVGGGAVGGPVVGEVFRVVGQAILAA